MNQTEDQRTEKISENLDENLCEIRLTVKEAAEYVTESPVRYQIHAQKIA